MEAFATMSAQLDIVGKANSKHAGKGNPWETVLHFFYRLINLEYKDCLNADNRGRAVLPCTIQAWGG